MALNVTFFRKMFSNIFPWQPDLDFPNVTTKILLAYHSENYWMSVSAKWSPSWTDWMTDLWVFVNDWICVRQHWCGFCLRGTTRWSASDVRLPCTRGQRRRLRWRWRRCSFDDRRCQEELNKVKDEQMSDHDYEYEICKNELFLPNWNDLGCFRYFAKFGFAFI